MLCQKLDSHAALFAAGAWLSLGMSASTLERASIPPNLASTLIESGKLDAEYSLRWRGRLRSDPLQVPWGTRYEINLEEVETSAGVTPVAGGLRLTYYKEDRERPSPNGARRGSHRSFCPRAPRAQLRRSRQLRLSRLSRSPEHPTAGALRNAQLLTIVDHPRLTISDRLARARGRFLSSLNNLFGSRPEEAALARAMLLGDRSFVEHDRVVDFQKTGVYHVLVLAGLHVARLRHFSSGPGGACAWNYFREFC